ncbi:MAG: hypothetical protein OXE44_10700 [Nitrospinae bacterium]|nr:hypothetical protein [Nitrospinota bacterium]
MPEHDISTPENYATRPTSYGIITVIIILTILSFVGILDDFAKGYVEETRNESIGIYAISKSINAGISVLQSTQFSIGIASAQIGELLDPINDAVERLSSVIVWAIGSLFLQQIVIQVVASSVFNWGFVVIGLAALLGLILPNLEGPRNWFSKTSKISKDNLERWSGKLVRVFIFAAIFRFIVPVFVLLSCAVSQMLLDSKIDEHKDNLSHFKQDLDNTKKQVMGDAGNNSLHAPRSDERKTQKESASETSRKLESTSLQKPRMSNKEAAKKPDEKAGSSSWLKIPDISQIGDWGTANYTRLKEFLNKPGKTSREVVEKASEFGKKAIDKASEIGKATVEQFSKTSKEIVNQPGITGKEVFDNAAQLSKEMLGIVGKMSQEMLDKATQMSKEILDKTKILGKPIVAIEKFAFKAEEMITNITMLLSAIAVKNIVIPLVFLLIALKCSLPLARYSMRLASGLRRDAKELQGYIERGD